jgi:hypothetical protein
MILMADGADLTSLFVAIAAGDRTLARAFLDTAPPLATARLARRDEFFVAACHAQVYEDDNVVDQLTKLVDLRDRGALTEAEFEAQKAKLLAAD